MIELIFLTMLGTWLVDTIKSKISWYKTRKYWEKYYKEHPVAEPEPIKMITNQPDL